MIVNIGLVILNYKTYADTMDLLHSLEKTASGNCLKIYVVDNECDADKFDLLQNEANKLNLNICYLQSKENIGFAKGMNLGIHAAKVGGCEYVLCSNNDVIFPEDFCFSSFLAPFSDDESIGIIGPIIENRNGDNQNPLYYADPFHNKARTKLIKMLMLTPYIGRFLYFNKCRIGRINSTSKMECVKYTNVVYCLHGSFFALTPSYFKFYDGLDSNTFLYYEELILSKRLDRVSLKSFFNDGVKVIHKEDSATDAVFEGDIKAKRRFVLEQNYNSLCYFLREYVK